MFSRRLVAGLATMAMCVAAVAPFTPPIGTDKGSFIDASMVYGSAD
jgi:hypothetical protein